MKINPFMKYVFLFFGLGMPDKTSSPNIQIYSLEYSSKINEISHKKTEGEKKQFIINELNKPVLDFYVPVDTGQVSCVYGYRKINEEREFHKGLDIGILRNASLKFAERPDILAAASGIVNFAGYEAGYGKVVRIKHNGGIETIYAHLNNFFVKEGDTILAKQKIGEMGRSGNARSDKKGKRIHLHFEARKNNKPFNPNKYFKNYKKIGIDDTLYSSFSETNFVSYLPVEKIKQPENKTPESFYEIQIAASSNPLSKRKINKLEKMYGYPLKENKTNKIYKYSIKKFSSLEEAVKFKNSLNSKNNLGIIVYENSKIVETKWNF